MIEYNMRVFGKVSIGIHGKELPKFAEDPKAQEYWKLRPGHYVADPPVQSRAQLLQTQKYWAKPDRHLLSDVSAAPAPADLFKTAYVPRKRRDELPCKINTINTFTTEPTEPFVARNRRRRWTSTVDRFIQRPRGKNEPDPDQRSTVIIHEQEPLYSSFTPDKVFVDPLSKSRTGTKPSYGVCI